MGYGGRSNQNTAFQREERKTEGLGAKFGGGSTPNKEGSKYKAGRFGSFKFKSFHLVQSIRSKGRRKRKIEEVVRGQILRSLESQPYNLELTIAGLWSPSKCTQPPLQRRTVKLGSVISVNFFFCI